MQFFLASLASFHNKTQNTSFWGNTISHTHSSEKCFVLLGKCLLIPAIEKELFFEDDQSLRYFKDVLQKMTNTN